MCDKYNCPAYDQCSIKDLNFVYCSGLKNGIPIFMNIGHKIMPEKEFRLGTNPAYAGDLFGADFMTKKQKEEHKKTMEWLKNYFEKTSITEEQHRTLYKPMNQGIRRNGRQR